MKIFEVFEVKLPVFSVLSWSKQSGGGAWRLLAIVSLE